MEVYHTSSFFYFFFVIVCIVHGQNQEGQQCQRIDINGVCKPIKSCPYILDLLIKANTIEDRNYIKSLTCGNSYPPIVCCPSFFRKPTDVVTEDNIPNNDQLSEDLPPLLAAPDCGFSNITLPKVVGGKPANLGDFPWAVLLGYRSTKNPNQPRWLCGGSLITERHVLTAAHCLIDTLYVVRVGELDLYNDNDGAHPVNIPIIKKVAHENYNPSKFTVDIGIVTLSQSTRGIQGVVPVCLPWEPDKITKTFQNYKPFVAGWGSTSYNGPSSSILQIATVPVVSQSICEEKFASQSIIDEKVICAGNLKGGIDSCKGDSGGPLMYGVSNPERNRLSFYQIGIVSYGFKCAEPGYPGVYTRVTYYINWIRKNIA